MNSELGFSLPLPLSGTLLHWWLPTSASSGTDSLRLKRILCHRNSLSGLFVPLIPGELLRKLFHTPTAEIQTLKQVGAKEALGGGTSQR